MTSITPFLWFPVELQEVVETYSKIFPDFSVSNTQKGPDGKFFSANFTIGNQSFLAMYAESEFVFTEAFSVFVHCETQEEVNRYWNGLIEKGGNEGRCGWLKDKFGLSWQIVPNMLGSVLGGSDQNGAKRAMEAMLSMQKLDIQKLQDAYDGR